MPAMVVVFGPNLAVDRVLDVPGFRAGGVFRTGHTRVVAGGKGANVARALRALGVDVHLVGFVAGWTGRFIRESLADEGIPATLIEVGGLSRTCTLLIDPSRGQATVVNEEGELTVREADIARLLHGLAALAPQARAVTLSGSLPPAVPDDLYARVIRQAHAAGVPTILDTSGRPLQHGLAAGPWLVKPNRSELLQLLSLIDARHPGAAAMPVEPAVDLGPSGDEGTVASAARRLLAYGVTCAVVSMGAAGALAVTSDGTWLARAPAVRVTNPIGAGDSMVAALAEGVARGRRLPEMLRRAVAAGSADVATFGPGVIDRDEVERLAAAVEPVPLAAGVGPPA